MAKPTKREKSKKPTSAQRSKMKTNAAKLAAITPEILAVFDEDVSGAEMAAKIKSMVK